MAPVYVDPDKVHPFASAQAFYDWLAKHHDTETEVWVRIFKKATGTPTINAVEGIEVVLCWGWIDAIRKSYDDVSFVQRYTRRGPKSLWSQVNQDNVAKLLSDGRMTEHGMRHVEAAKADGRWAAAYKMDMPPPEELLAAIEASPKAMEFYGKLSAQNRFALTFRTHNLKTAAGRAKRIASFVEMLENGETIYPQGKKS
ncbi:YdeI/OmpD-associated family protein [Devosia sp.]|uniref:YdeI/OmpD-associated family protein n=1 Tax=Devosia sp. TaxID=1871048 RepID=UPI003266076C